MPIPGTTVNVTTATTQNVPISSTGTFFAVGQTASGPFGVPVTITSLEQYIAVYGGRTDTSASSTLYDAIDTFFQEGGQVAIISRVFAAASASGDTASLTLEDQNGTPHNTLKVSALGPGEYGNDITVTVTTGTVSDSYILTITNGDVTEVSPNLLSPNDAALWALSYSQTVVITNLDSVSGAPDNNPANISATDLAGGVDNTSPADSDFVAALAVFPIDLGVGQVAAPGRTTPTVWEALMNHALSFSRWALLDGENLPDSAVSTVLSDASTVQENCIDPSYGFTLLGYPIYQGVPTQTQTPAYPRVVSPSGPVAGSMAALASAGNNADVAAAGNNGILSHAIGVSFAYSDAHRGTLDAAGVAVIRQYNGLVQLYGYTSMSQDPNWVDAGNGRLRMQIIGGVRAIGDSYAFADIDAAGKIASAFGGQISAYLDVLYHQGALFGGTAADAFSVNVGPNVNTPATAQLRELIADVAVRMSPTSDQVIINVTRYPVTAALPSV